MSNPARMVDIAASVSPSLTYEPYFGLREKAFSLSADPRFLYTGPSHVRAFEQLLAGIRRREGLIVLSGEIGTGKTTLCRGVLERLDRRTFTTFVRDPFLSREDLLKTLLIDFGVMSIADLKGGRLAGATRPDLSYPLYEFLDSLVPLQAFAVLIIDEAQNLSPELLEEIRILSELEAREKLLQVVLVGQPELKQQLKLPQLRQVDQRVSVRCELAPLPGDEVKQYVSHRLRVASVGEPAVAFTADAVRMVAEASRGVPRVINLICDGAMNRGFMSRSNGIEAPHVAAALDDLQLKLERGDAVPAIASVRDAQSVMTAVHATTERETPPPVAAPELADPLAEFSHEADLARTSAGRRRRTAIAAVLLVVAMSAALALWYARARVAAATAAIAAPQSITIETPAVLAHQAGANQPVATGQSGLQIEQGSVPSASAASVLEPSDSPVASAQPPGEPVDPISDRAADDAPAGAPNDVIYAIQVASFQSRARASRLVDELMAEGYRAEAIAVSLGARGLWWQVLAGRYETPEEAERHLREIREKPYYADARLTLLDKTGSE